MTFKAPTLKAGRIPERIWWRCLALPTIVLFLGDLVLTLPVLEPHTPDWWPSGAWPFGLFLSLIFKPARKPAADKPNDSR